MKIIRAIDLTGQRFGRLVALYSKSFNGRLKWFCQCDCGNQVWVNTGGLRNGGTKSCGCLHKEYKDYTGQKIGKLTVIEYVGHHIDKSGKKRIIWKCLCDCGNITYVTSDNFHSTSSCGCHKNQSASERFSLKIEGQRFGKLVVLKRVGTQIQGNGDKKSLWLCHCDCGTEIEVIGKNLLNGNTQSCGCVQSRGELAVREYLNKLKVPFSTQKTFPDLRSSRNGLLRFDFAIYDSDKKLLGLIEYQGIQHYKDTGRGQLEREETDELKVKYCQANKIPLLSIPYNQNLEILINQFLESINYMPTLCQASNRGRCNDYPFKE